jgi:hypothetical protein
MRAPIFVATGLVAFLGATALGATGWADDGLNPGSAACFGDPRTQRAYQAGVRGGFNLVDRAWRTGNGCPDLPRIEAVVLDALSRLIVPPGASLYVRCRAIGLGDGAEKELQVLRSACTSEATDGED